MNSLLCSCCWKCSSSSASCLSGAVPCLDCLLLIRTWLNPFFRLIGLKRCLVFLDLLSLSVDLYCFSSSCSL
jgi:hypothetical protein